MVVKTGFGGREIRFLHREIDLPINPFIGLDIMDHGSFEARIENIVYNIDTKEVELWNHMDDSISRAKSQWPTGEYRTLKEVVAEYVKYGWIEDE